MFAFQCYTNYNIFLPFQYCLQPVQFLVLRYGAAIIKRHLDSMLQYHKTCLALFPMSVFLSTVLVAPFEKVEFLSITFAAVPDSRGVINLLSSFSISLSSLSLRSERSMISSSPELSSSSDSVNYKLFHIIHIRCAVRFGTICTI